jgi:hypothetical protein
MNFFKNIKFFFHRISRGIFYTYFHYDDYKIFDKTANKAEYKTWKWINSNLGFFKKSENEKYTILEVGCVNGRNLIMSNKKMVNYIGLDLNKKAIIAGNKFIKTNKISNIKLYQGSISTFNFYNINLIVNISLCIYLNPKELLIYFNKIINSNAEYAIFVDIFSKGKTLEDYYYYHSLNQFTVFKNKYYLMQKKFIYQPWVTIDCDTKFIIIYKKNLKNKINNFLRLQKFDYLESG